MLTLSLPRGTSCLLSLCWLGISCGTTLPAHTAGRLSFSHPASSIKIPSSSWAVGYREHWKWPVQSELPQKSGGEDTRCNWNDPPGNLDPALIRSVDASATRASPSNRFSSGRGPRGHTRRRATAPITSLPGTCRSLGQSRFRRAISHDTHPEKMEGTTWGITWGAAVGGSWSPTSSEERKLTPAGPPPSLWLRRRGCGESFSLGRGTDS